MISAIVRLPNRLQFGSILSGGNVIEKKKFNNTLNLLSGRSIRIVPLIFYKFFSQWGHSRYEHIFATDEPFDPVSMSRFVDSSTGNFSHSKIGSVLVPISMKKISNKSIETFLFAKSINFLLTSYQVDMPLSAIPFSGPQHFNFDKSLEVPCNGLLSGGVSSYGDYRKFLFEDVLYSTYGSTSLPPDIEFALSQMTIEQPASIDSCMEELSYNYVDKNSVWDYIDELYRYESGEPADPKEFFTEYNYSEKGINIDPLTLKCLRSPTYILSNSLKPYLADNITMRNNALLGLCHQDTEFTRNIIPLNFTSLGSYFKYEMLEYIMSIPDDGFSIQMDWDTYVFDNYSIFNQVSSMPIELLHGVCRQIFLNKYVNSQYVYDDILISKNMFDEIFISCKNKTQLVTFYISLPLFHLISPSLINKSTFIKD